MLSTYRPGAKRHPEAAAMARLQRPQAPTQPASPPPQQPASQAPVPQQPVPQQPVPQQPAIQQQPSMPPVASFREQPQPPPYLTPMPMFNNQQPRIASQPRNTPPVDATAYYEPKRDHGAALAANKAQHDASFNHTSVDPNRFNMDSYNWMKRTYGY